MSHPKLHQIVRLRHMLTRWRRKSLQNSHSFSDVTTGSSSGRSRSVHTRRSLSLPSCSHSRVPAGHLAVYVGDERKRFVIKTSYLSHPLFKALLKKTEEEMGFHHEGALAIPCEVPFFEHLLHLIEDHHHSQHHNIMNILHLSSPRPHHHRHRSDDYALPPHHQELLQELLHLSLLDSSHLSSSSCSASLNATRRNSSSSLCNLTHSLSSIDVSAAKVASQVVLA